MDIYINMKKKVYLKQKTLVTIADIADVEGPPAMKQKIGALTVLKKKNKVHEAVDFNDIVKIIHGAYPDIALNNTGEQTVLIEFSDRKKENIIFSAAKIAFICVVLFAGASTAIMSFHSDAQMYKVFEKYTELFLGEGGDVRIIQVSYSIGLAAGIIVFFNHFAGKKLTDDPTPIQVEMNLYENDVTQTMVDIISAEKEQ